MPDQKIVSELAKLWAKADPDTQWAMVQWIKYNERNIEWPLFPELLAAYARGKREAERDFGALDNDSQL